MTAEPRWACAEHDRELVYNEALCWLECPTTGCQARITDEMRAELGWAS
jgi:hypothetical protein